MPKNLSFVGRFKGNSGGKPKPTYEHNTYGRPTLASSPYAQSVQMDLSQSDNCCSMTSYLLVSAGKQNTTYTLYTKQK